MTPLVADPDFVLYVGDAVEVMRELPAASVQCCVTSPPYWGLRDYGYDGQLGLEATPEEYVARMVEVFREVSRVLRADGTVWLNIGDTYASQGGSRHGSTETLTGQGSRREAESDSSRSLAPGMKAKDLVGVPWRLAFALQEDGWYLRSDIIWAKPNPMPESVTDRPTKAHEYVFLLTKSAKYFYDANAIREPHSPDGRHKTIHDHATDYSHPNYDNVGKGNERWPNGGRNKRSVWEIPTEPYPEAHFATFPQALVEPCIKAGTSEHGCCPECGAPWERQVERTALRENKAEATRQRERSHDFGPNRGKRGVGGSEGVTLGVTTDVSRVTLGWEPGCGHGCDPVPCTVLDPFLGSGTTALVARRLDRRCIGIELNPEYGELAAKRLGQQSLLA